MKKLLAMLLSLCLLVCLFAGCGETTQPAEDTATEEVTEETTTETTTEELPAYMGELLEKMGAYADDTVVLAVDGVDITWDLFYYMLSGSLSEYAYYLGDLPADFAMEVTAGTTMEDYFNQMTLEQCKLVGSILSRAIAEGVIPSAETEEEILAGWDEMSANYGGDEAVRALSFMTRNAYLDIMRFDLSNSGLQTKMYGTTGELFPAEDAIAWAERNQFVSVKHILYSYKDAEGNEMDEAGKAEVMAKAESVLEELKALEGDNAALEARFDEIMHAESADQSGLMGFPNGYTFTTGEMVDEFEAAAFELAPYALSEPVPSTYGVHILLRLPMDPDATTRKQSNYGYYTIRELAISEDYQLKMQQWMDEAEVVWAEGFENFSVLELFPERIGTGTMVNETVG